MFNYELTYGTIYHDQVEIGSICRINKLWRFVPNITGDPPIYGHSPAHIIRRLQQDEDEARGNNVHHRTRS